MTFGDRAHRYLRKLRAALIISPAIKAVRRIAVYRLNSSGTLEIMTSAIWTATAILIFRIFA
jgi:hypothetical protein